VSLKRLAVRAFLPSLGTSGVVGTRSALERVDSLEREGEARGVED
jgi:hypothetical protein